MAPFIITQTDDPEVLKQNLLGDTTGLHEIKFTLTPGDEPRAFGTLNADPFGLGTGIVLSTGRVTDLVGANQVDGGFSPSANQDLSYDFGSKGQADDSITLKIDFLADGTKDKLYFQYVFGSEEFLEYAGRFNDSFSLTLNGKNLAKLPNGDAVNINNLAKSPFGPRSEYFRYNSAEDGAVRDQTRLDGYALPITFQGNLNLDNGGRNTLVVNVQDARDGVFDTAVFLKGGTLGTKPPPGTPPDDGEIPSGTPTVNDGNIVKLPGLSTQTTNLLFTLTGVDARFINEVGLFKVNDDKGGLDLDNDGRTDLLPGDRDYTQAVLEQGKVIFSALPQGGVPDATRILDFQGNDRLAFYLVQNSSTDEVLRGITPASRVLFGSTFGKGAQQLQIEQPAPSDPLTLKWEDGTNGGDRDFNDVVLTVQSTNQTSPQGTRLQGRPQGELIDLRGVDLNSDSQTDSIIQGSFSVNSEAAKDNFVGFYRVDNTNGLIDNLLPGDQGYAEEAVKRSVVSFDRKGIDSVQLSGEQLGLLAPYIIDTGTPEQFLKKNPNNQSDKGPLAYFNYLGANPDRADHIRLLADNVFGFEDSIVHLNFDFNDMVVQGHLSAAA